jgi:hypothetical protein
LRGNGTFIAEAEELTMVRVEFIGLEANVMLAGENEHAHPVGRPEQESDTGLVNVPD